MTGKQSERLYVEREVGRRSLGPELHDLRRWHRVLAAIDLNEWKLRRVIAEPALGRAALGRIEATRRDQALVGARRGAKKNLSQDTEDKALWHPELSAGLSVSK